MSSGRSWVVAFAAGLFGLAASCGSRSGLLEGAPASSSGGAGGTPSGGTGAVSGSSGFGGSSGGPVDSGNDVDAPPPPPCALVAAGAAVDVVSFPDRHATAPSAVTIASGTPAAAAKVALQTFASGGNSMAHDDIELVGFTLGSAWPGGFVQVNAPALYGIESHGWAELVHAPSANQLALAWHGDPGGNGRPMFRLWDVGSWAPQAPVDLAPDGEAVLDLAPGAGIGSLGVGYAGFGYALIWRDVQSGPQAPTRPVAVITNESGQVVFGPHPLAEYLDYPGRSPSVVWTGAAYVTATAAQSCAPGETLCQPLSVVIARLRPASGDYVDDSGIDLVTVLPSQAGTAVVGRAALSSHGGRTFVAWSESDQSAPGAPRRIRVAELSALGELVSGPMSVDDSAPMVTRVSLLASDLGVTLTWAEDSDSTVPDNVVGRSRIVSTHLSPDLGMLSYRVTVPTTRVDDYGAPNATPLAVPKSLLIVWSGRRETGAGYEDAWATRLDCAF